MRGKSSWGRTLTPPVEVKPRSVTISRVHGGGGDGDGDSDGDGDGDGGGGGNVHWYVAGVAGAAHRHHLLVEVKTRPVAVSPSPVVDRPPGCN